MKKILYILSVFLLITNVNGQNEISEYVGVYGDLMDINGNFTGTRLELKADKTFELRTVDNVYPQTFRNYTNNGKWIVQGGEVILNPHLKKRKPTVNIIEKEIGLKDSIEIKVNHYIELYKNQEMVKKDILEFDLLTLYFNKKRNYKTLSRDWFSNGSCAWAPRIRNRINLDSTNTFKISKIDIEKIGVYTYGFTEYIETRVKGLKSDYFAINIVVPVDKERMPRNKKVIIKGNRAYFYEIRGKVSKSNNLWKKQT